MTGFSYRHLFDNGFYNTGLSRNYVDYNTRQNDSLLKPIFLNKSLEEENSLRADVFYKLSEKSEINFGGTLKFVEAGYNIFFPTYLTSFGDSLAVSNLNTENNYTKLGAYFNYNRLLFNKINVNLGF